MIHFLSSVTDFYGGSDMVPWSHLRHPFLGRMWTDLTSELTHFNLIIRQTVGHSVHHHFAISRRSCCPCESLELSPLLEWSHAEQPEIPFFIDAQASAATCNMKNASGRSMLFR